MRRVTKGARLAVAAAILTSLLCGAALFKLAAVPRVTRALTPPPSELPERHLALATPDGLLVVEAEAAYRLTPSLERLSWPDGLHVTQIRSVAWLDGALAIVYNGSSPDRPVRDGVVVVRHDRVDEIEVPALRSPERLLSVQAVGDHFELYLVTDFQFGVGTNTAHLMTAELPREATSALRFIEAPISSKIHVTAIEGVLRVNDQPLLLVGERNAHWLIDFQGNLKTMPGGATSVWSASHIPWPAHSPVGRGMRTPFLDEHGGFQAFASGVTYLTFALDGQGRLGALPVTHGLDEPGVLVTSYAGERLELKHARRRLYAASPSHVVWRAVATSSAPYDFAAFPLHGNWLALSDGVKEVALVDNDGARLQPTSTAATVLALTGRPIVDWLALLALLGGFALALPLLAIRTARALRILDEKAPRADQPGASGLLTGTLRLQPGAVVHIEGSGRAALVGICELQSAGGTVELTSGPQLLDGAYHRPLVDGDTVYAVGTVEVDGEGGPMRATHKKRLVPAQGRYFIGRGTAADFARDLAARENAALLRFALLHLSFALTVLGFLALRPFA